MPDQSTPGPARPEETAWDRAVRLHEESLTVGTRVRVQLNGECPSEHDPSEQGATGRVIGIPAHYQGQAQTSGHRFGVAFDGPGITIDGAWWWGSAYAPTELIVLDADA